MPGSTATDWSAGRNKSLLREQRSTIQGPPPRLGPRAPPSGFGAPPPPPPPTPPP